MVTIPKQLQPPQRPLTQAQKRVVSQPQPIPITPQQTQAQEDLSGIKTYEEYFSRYEQLSPEQKQFYTSPEELKQTPEYQSYQQSVRDAGNYNLAVRVYLGQVSTPAEFSSIPLKIRQEAQRTAEGIERSSSWTKYQGKLIPAQEVRRLQQDFERKLASGEILGMSTKEGEVFYEAPTPTKPDIRQTLRAIDEPTFFQTPQPKPPTFFQEAKSIYGGAYRTVSSKTGLGAGALSIPVFSLGVGGGTTEIDFTPTITKSITKFEERLRQPRQDEIQQLTEKISDKYLKQMSQDIQNKYQTSLDRNEISWDQATEEYKRSADFQQITDSYNEEINTKIKKLGYRGITTARGKDILADVVSVIPKTRGGLLFTAGTFGLWRGGYVGGKIALGIGGYKPISSATSLLYETTPTPPTRVGSFGKAVVFGAVAPRVVATAFGTSIGIGLITEPSSTISGLGKWVKESPEEIIGFTVGGAGRGIIKGRGARAEVIAAIEKAKIEPIKSKGFLTEQKIGTIEYLTGEQKTQFKELINRGYSIKEVKYNLKSAPGKEKFTPKVDAKFIEISDSLGNIIQTIAIGEIKATLKGKTMSRVEVAKAFTEIQKETGKPITFVEAMEFEAPVGEFRPKLSEFIVKTEPIGVKKLPGGRLISGEFTGELIGQKTYPYKEFVKGKFGAERDPFLSVSKYGVTKEGISITPDWAVFKGVPTVKGKFVELQRLKRGAIETKQVREFGLMEVTTQFDTFGIGVAERIPKAKAKPSKPLRWGFGEGVEPRVKTEPFKPFKAKAEAPVDLVAPSYVGGEGGLVSVSKYGGYSSFGVSEAVSKTLIETSVKDFGGRVGFGAGFGEGFIKGVRPSVSITPIYRTKIEGRTEQVSLFSQLDLQLDKEGEKFYSALSTSSLFQQPVKDYQEISPVLRLGSAQVEGLKQPTQPKQVMGFGIQTPTPQQVPTTPLPIVPFGFGLHDEVGRTERVGYDAEYLRGATTPQKKWVKINKKPMTKEGALDLMSEKVDRNISARGRIVAKTKMIKVEGKKKGVPVVKKYGVMELGEGTGYYEDNSYKFREYRVKKKRKITTPMQFIEKSAYRLDMPSEVKKIQRERRMSDFLFGGGNKGEEQKVKKGRMRFRL